MTVMKQTEASPLFIPDQLIVSPEHVIGEENAKVLISTIFGRDSKREASTLLRYRMRWTTPLNSIWASDRKLFL
jgi:hypothetical protein